VALSNNLRQSRLSAPDKENAPEQRLAEAWRRHERVWKDHRYVYAVISLRSGGVSVGLNLSPDKACNFNCVYCQVDRAAPRRPAEVDMDRLTAELDDILQAEKDGSLYMDAPFDALLPAERGLRDIAFSGDGEPTAYSRFEEAVRVAATARRGRGLQSSKLVLITNAAYLDNPGVFTALRILDENNGEIWAKLDAGTEEYFRRVNRSAIPLSRILENIQAAARIRPLVIQSLWMRLRGEQPAESELAAWLGRLKYILAGGGRLKAIQLNTIVRNPAERSAAPLTRNELERIETFVKSEIPVPVEIYV
ncbi:MAG: radical SAM protein, partial [Acidobacteria bacterium]|nr:radical SAM protein [Acidobacteriota bacterium]